MKHLLFALALVLTACGLTGHSELSPTAHCQRRCEILFDCLDWPIGPGERDLEEFGECIASCNASAGRPCEHETLFECTKCWESRTCKDVTTGACDWTCTAGCP